MRNLILPALLLTSAFQSTFAQGLLQQTFGSGANAFTMDFVTIGNPGNAADTTGSPNPAGSVDYTYSIGKYEVSREMIDKANSAGVLGITYSSYQSSRGNQPAGGISWVEAAKFVNWLNTSTGSQAAYKFDGSGNIQLWSSTEAGYNANNLFRNNLAKFFLPSTDEWYKAAYGSPGGTWYNYPTGNDVIPSRVAGGTDANTAVYNYTGSADINNAGGLSAWGTMAQGGNVWEWNETAFDGINDTARENRVIRGGSSFYLYEIGLDSSHLLSGIPTGLPVDDWGFRVASSIPEPSSLSMLGLGGVVLVLGRRRK